jgi:hypothetical protein
MAAVSTRLCSRNWCSPKGKIVTVNLPRPDPALHGARKKEICRSTTSPKASPDVKLPDDRCMDQRRSIVNIRATSPESHCPFPARCRVGTSWTTFTGGKLLKIPERSIMPFWATGIASGRLVWYQTTRYGVANKLPTIFCCTLAVSTSELAQSGLRMVNSQRSWRISNPCAIQPAVLCNADEPRKMHSRCQKCGP